MWLRETLFHEKRHRTLVVLSKQRRAFPAFWAIGWHISLILTNKQPFENLTYFLTWIPSYLTFDLKKQ